MQNKKQKIVLMTHDREVIHDKQKKISLYKGRGHLLSLIPDWRNWKNNATRSLCSWHREWIVSGGEVLVTVMSQPRSDGDHTLESTSCCSVVTSPQLSSTCHQEHTQEQHQEIMILNIFYKSLISSLWINLKKKL